MCVMDQLATDTHEIIAGKKPHPLMYMHAQREPVVVPDSLWCALRDAILGLGVMAVAAFIIVKSVQ